ncbi:MAG TPA: M23 family metallopeptidase [Pseudonocardiaceae bacterium]|nr:M23 family metallopeptidase [Pseudonocardiaceae bacterium]
MSRTLLCTALAALFCAAPAMALPASGPAPLPALPRLLSAAPGAGDADRPPRPAGRFGWPLPGSPAVARRFEPPAHRFGPGHRGVDLISTSGTPVLAAGPGTVVFAGPVAGRGVVSIEHAGGLRTTYEPVLPSVATGDQVATGQQIGTVAPGHPGCPVPTCLHWGARRGTSYLDPLRLLAPDRVRLLPWPTGPGER